MEPPIWIEGDFDGDFEGDASAGASRLSGGRSTGRIFRGQLTNSRRCDPSEPLPDSTEAPIRQSLIPEVFSLTQVPGQPEKSYRFALADAQIYQCHLTSNRDGDPTVGTLLGRIKGKIRARLVAIPSRESPKPGDRPPPKPAEPESGAIADPVGDASTTGGGGDPEIEAAAEVGDPTIEKTSETPAKPKPTFGAPLAETKAKAIAECPVCQFTLGLFTAALVGATTLLIGDDWLVSAWTVGLLIVPWALSCLIRIATSDRPSGETSYRFALLRFFLLGVLWAIQNDINETNACIDFFAWPTYVMALIFISFGVASCWHHGYILLGWTVFLLSLNTIGINQCRSSTSDRNLPIEMAEVVAQPGVEVPQSEEPSVKDTPNPKPVPSNKKSESSGRTRLEGLLDRMKAKVTENFSESTWRDRMDRARDQVKEGVSGISKWLGETKDLSAEKVEKDSRKLSDGLTRITIEKAISSPERYFSCKSADGAKLGRPRYTVYLGAEAIFGFSSAELQPNAEVRLNKLGELLRLSEKKEIVISGHADRSGLSDKNETLSRRRAETIADWLVHSGYLDQRNVQVRGEGDRVPYIATDQAEPLNRRVEVRVDCERKRTAFSMNDLIRNLAWG